MTIRILGHNGAGKSALMKILTGAERADAGEIRVEGKPVTIDNPCDARALGIETTYQTLALAENLDAPANVFLGREVTTPSGLLDEEAMEHATGTVLNRLGLRIASLRETVMNLSGGQRQAIAISRTVHCNRGQ